MWGAIGAAAVGVVGSAVLGGGGGGGGGGGSPQPTPNVSGGGGQQSLGGAMGNLYLTSQGASNIQQAGKTAAGMSDPFATSRTLANTQLQSLMANPGQMANDPSYQWAVDQGTQAVDRSLAARHMSASGNALTELTQFGQGLASQQYNARLDQLSRMASQGANPAAAGQQYLNATETAQSGLTAGQMGVMAAASPVISSAGNWLGGAVNNTWNSIANGSLMGSSSPDVAGVTPNYGSTGVDMTGFQNPNYSSSFTPSVGGAYDYSTSYGTTPSYDTGLSGLSSSWWSG